ncbi:MAG: GNAT family N-acetyltransferase [Actinobacteria bacterium]|nr:GNAT family N-acetyltransferase [Actinomycetota bacterium]
MVSIFEPAIARRDATGIEEAPPHSFKSFWPEVRRGYSFRNRQRYLEFMRTCDGRIYVLQDPGSPETPFALVGNWRSNGDIRALWHLKGHGDARELLARGVAARSFEEGASLFVTRPLGEGEAEEFRGWGFTPLYRIVLLERRPRRVEEKDTGGGGVKFIRFHRRHLQEVLELDSAAFDVFWRLDRLTLDAVASSCARNLFLLARGRDRLDGYAIGGVNGRFGYLQRLGVRAGRQGEGIGEALARRLISALTAMGAGVICVNTQEENLAARSLYRKLGFEEMPHRRLIMGRTPDGAGWDR